MLTREVLTGIGPGPVGRYLDINGTRDMLLAHNEQSFLTQFACHTSVYYSLFIICYEFDRLINSAFRVFQQIVLLSTFTYIGLV